MHFECYHHLICAPDKAYTSFEIFVKEERTKIIIQRSIQLYLDLWIELVILTLLHTGIIYAMIAKDVKKTEKDLKFD